MLNVCLWNDKQLDELVDMLRSADYSAVSTFIANNFLCSGSRIMTDDISSTLRATVGTDKKTIVLSAGVFVHAGKCSQLDTNQIINILDTTTGSWGTGLDGGAINRYDIICVKNAEQAHTIADRWFVNDSVVPNTYAQQSANTLLNKAYYDIVVVHGTVAGVVPAAPSGYWAIAEIYVPIGCIALDGVGVVINDTTGTSNSIVGPEAGGKNWVATTRVLRMEFWSTKFNVDHDPATGWHRTEAQGGWHIGADMVRATATEMNQALDGIGGTVTAASLTKLTNGSTLVAGELHQHGVGDFISQLPRWRKKLTYSTTPIFTMPSQFVGVTLIGSEISLGSIMVRYTNSLIHSYLYEMQVNNITGGVISILQNMEMEDDDIHFYLNGTKFLEYLGYGTKNKDVTWVLQPGINLLQIVLVDRYGVTVDLHLTGDIVNGTTLSFVQL